MGVLFYFFVTIQPSLRLDTDGEFMKFDVGLHGKNGCYFQTLD